MDFTHHHFQIKPQIATSFRTHPSSSPSPSSKTCVTISCPSNLFSSHIVSPLYSKRIIPPLKIVKRAKRSPIKSLCVPFPSPPYIIPSLRMQGIPSWHIIHCVIPSAKREESLEHSYRKRLRDFSSLRSSK